MSFKLLHLLKLLLIPDTFFGIKILSIECSIEFSEKLTLFNLTQPSKAKVPIISINDEIVIDYKFRQLQNASDSIVDFISMYIMLQVCV